MTKIGDVYCGEGHTCLVIRSAISVTFSYSTTKVFARMYCVCVFKCVCLREGAGE